MPDNKLDTLMAELRVIEVWDEAVGWNPESELERVGLEARRMRRSEIIRELILQDIERPSLPRQEGRMRNERRRPHCEKSPA